MLQLTSIHKSYDVGDSKTEALRGISIAFRQNEFVAVLGPSGCGKTTLLNVIGGLDNFDGELIIKGRSTKQYTGADWDTYRNRSVGFVFQNYNLIPHQTVLANVELALTLSGIGKTERRKRAMDALKRVGIEDQAKKKPNQLSGGQMQRVAIARALINNPDILLADEPTGALDSETSLQIMEILKEISKEKLVIVVTHNSELANGFASRIINMKDGVCISDSDVYTPVLTDDAKVSEKSRQKTYMSFRTALSLSLNNLLTKKTRTALTSIAGSIGIIGIALILSLSSGMSAYIGAVQEKTLAGYPISVKTRAMDMPAFMSELIGTADGLEYEHGDGDVYAKPILGHLLNSWLSERSDNDLDSFKKYVEDNKDSLSEFVSDVKYSYGIDLNVYSKNTENGIVKVNPMDVFSILSGTEANSSILSYANTTSLNVWSELMDNEVLLESSYEPLGNSRWPQKYDEVVLFVNEDSEINDYVLCGLGLADQSDISQMMADMLVGKPVENELKTYSYEDILGLTFSLVPSSAQYVYDENQHIWVDKSNDERYMKTLIDNGTEIKIVGIMRPKNESAAAASAGKIGYLHELTEHCISINNDSEIVKQQKSDATDVFASEKYGKTLKYSEIDVFTGIPFGYEPILNDITLDDVFAYINSLPEEQRRLLYEKLDELDLSDSELIELFKNQYFNNSETTKATYKDNLKKLGAAEFEIPTMISFYAKDFESKKRIEEFIDGYNDLPENADSQIHYTDYAGVMMSSIGEIISGISYVLIAFVAISLIVSSIMIGIITYISVLERTKEIGILRALGASKTDISRVFNAETLILGFVSGILGIIATIILNIPLNLAIKALSGIESMASLPISGAVILIAVSMLMTFTAGLIPSKIASDKDPVVALRSE